MVSVRAKARGYKARALRRFQFLPPLCGHRRSCQVLSKVHQPPEGLDPDFAGVWRHVFEESWFRCQITATLNEQRFGLVVILQVRQADAQSALRKRDFALGS